MTQRYERLLGVNIDHIATLRQARGTRYPEPLQAALIAEQAGADAITLHLREDRRHIQDRDVRLLAGCLQTRMNLEMAATAEMLAIARDVRPAECCLVPERREELTTEAGWTRRARCRRSGTTAGRSPMPACASLCSSTPTAPDRGRGGHRGAGRRDPHRALRERGLAAARERELVKIADAVRLGVDAGLYVNAATASTTTTSAPLRRSTACASSTSATRSSAARCSRASPRRWRR